MDTAFPPESPSDLWDRLRLLQQEKNGGKGTKRNNEEIVQLIDIIDKLWNYESYESNATIQRQLVFCRLAWKKWHQKKFNHFLK